ncbi:hypothetical protein ACGFIF_29155 [Kribbella sp. NPDC049174]|uniref:hypothetical protein n=1 Tax=Kribbella sp. NPDC049174 TaxID=3364112 RepID=UPI003720663C
MAFSDLSTTTSSRTAMIVALASLFLSGWTFIDTLSDERNERRIEQRLACLELPGPNDCGLDGK